MRLRKMELFRRLLNYALENEQYELEITIRGSLQELKEIQTVITETANSYSKQKK